MLLSIFSSFYELICGSNPDFPEYRDSIFNYVGLLTLIVSAVICLIFYVALGRWKPIFYKLTHWIITIILVSLTCFALAYYYSKSIIETSDSYLVSFAGINALYAAIYFIILSF